MIAAPGPTSSAPGNSCNSAVRPPSTPAALSPEINSIPQCVPLPAKVGLDILACAILPQHIHIVLARHRLSVESLANHLKDAATQRLIEERLHPQAEHQATKSRPPKACARGQWKVFLEDRADVARSISYVNKNPERERLPAQRWSFITAYNL
jgi:REP element-mobilizing transposase RayT